MRRYVAAFSPMAPACLPTMFQAVEIDGVPYWDGGYIGSPALFPFHAQTGSDDVVVIQINPIERKDKGMVRGAPASRQKYRHRRRAADRLTPMSTSPR